MWRTVKSLGYNEGTHAVKYIDVQNFLTKQHTYTLFKPRRVRYPKNRSLPIPGANHLLGMDIWELKRFTELEKTKEERRQMKRGKSKPRIGKMTDLSYKYVLVGIDGFSKRIAAVPMKDKSQDSVVEALESMVQPPAKFKRLCP